MSGVMRLILDRDEGSARGEDDFFSVARTIPLVATGRVRACPGQTRGGGVLGLGYL